MVLKVADALREKGIIIKEVLSGIAVKESEELLSNSGIDVKSAFYISNVLDEVCERDFYFGIAQSGQNLLTENNLVIKQPYFSPYGDPVSSASVPEDKVAEFSRLCSDCSYLLWKNMQENSNRVLTSQDLPEKINNTPFEDGFEILPLLEEAAQGL